MEEKSSPLLKSSLTYGLYLGLISILLSVIIWAGGLIESMGLLGGLVISGISLIITFVLLFVFAKNYRNTEFGGYISFGEIFKFTMLVIIVSTIISVLYTYIFHSFIAPDYMKELMTTMQEKTLAYMEKVGASDIQIEQAMEKLEEIPTIGKTLKQAALGGIIGGGIIALIVSAIVKKSDEEVLV